MEVNGIKFHIEEKGNGEPLILIHGGTESVDEVRRLMDPLSEQFRVIAIDLRAHGYSGGDFRTITYEAEFNDLQAIIKELGLKTYHFVGHSDGAILGIFFALRCPEQVLSVTPISGNIHSQGVHQWVVDFLTNSDPDALPDKMKNNFLKHADDLSEFELYWKHMANLWMTSPNMSMDDLQKIQAPVLYIVADYDTIRLDHTVEMFEATPKANLLVLPESTHALESMDMSIVVPAIIRNTEKS